MRYTTAAAFRTALETRLLAHARQANVSIVRLRKIVVFDRLLARLLAVAPDRWLLKGALALDFRLGTRRMRATKDMDLGRADDEAATTDDFFAAQAIDLGDHFVFAVERTGALDQLVEGAAVRYRVAAELAGRPFERVTVDVGFGEPLPSPPETLRGPDLLAFADIAPLAIPVLPLEQHVAEKLHAYTRRYGAGRPNTRVKDLIDLVLIQASAPFEAGRLRAALVATFTDRDLQPLPPVVPPPPGDWGPAYRRLALEVGLEPEMPAGHRLAAAFLDPLLADAVDDRVRWAAAAGLWLPGIA